MQRVVTGLLLAAFLAVSALPLLARRERQALPLPEASVRIRVLTAHWEGVRREFDRAFRAWSGEHLGRVVGVEFLDVGGTADMVRYVQSEFARSPKGIGIDLLFGGGVEVYERLARRGLLQAVRIEPRLAAALARKLGGTPLSDPKGRWYGAALAGFGILCNRRVLARLGLARPKTWADLARPEFFTWLGSGNPRASGSTHMAFEIVLQARGWRAGYATLLRIAANTRAFSVSSAEVPRDVALGEVACGMALDSYAWSAMARLGRRGGKRLSYVLPKGETVVNPDGIAVLKGAPHARLAAAFLRFVLSPAGQRLWMLPKGTPGGPREFLLARMSILPEIHRELAGRTPVRTNPFSWSGGDFYDSAKASARWDVLNALLGACFVDNHAPLVAAWKALVAAGLPAEGLDALTAPPATEEEVLALAARWGKDPELRSRKAASWSRLCRSRYEALAARYGTGRSGCGD